MHMDARGSQRRATDPIDLETDLCVSLLYLIDEGEWNTEETPRRDATERNGWGVPQTTAAPRSQQLLKYKSKGLHKFQLE